MVMVIVFVGADDAMATPSKHVEWKDRRAKIFGGKEFRTEFLQ
jgi:hypothetical protein